MFWKVTGKEVSPQPGLTRGHRSSYFVSVIRRSVQHIAFMENDDVVTKEGKIPGSRGNQVA